MTNKEIVLSIHALNGIESCYICTELCTNIVMQLLDKVVALFDPPTPQHLILRKWVREIEWCFGYLTRLKGDITDDDAVIILRNTNCNITWITDVTPPVEVQVIPHDCPIFLIKKIYYVINYCISSLLYHYYVNDTATAQKILTIDHTLQRALLKVKFMCRPLIAAKTYDENSFHINEIKYVYSLEHPERICFI